MWEAPLTFNTDDGEPPETPKHTDECYDEEKRSPPWWWNVTDQTEPTAPWWKGGE